MGRAKRIWYLSPMRAAKVQASLRIRAVSPEPPLLAHTSSESRGTFRQKARSLAPLNGWACAVKLCHDGMLEDTNSLDGAHFVLNRMRNCIYTTLQLSLDFRHPNCKEAWSCLKTIAGDISDMSLSVIYAPIINALFSLNMLTVINSTSTAFKTFISFFMYLVCLNNKGWDTARQNQQNGLCAQRWLRSALASAQSDQSLRCPYEETLGP